MPKNITDKIYTIRGQKVILDYDLAELYGYETKAFNRQVQRNIEKFKGEEFMFQLTKLEAEQFSRSKNLTSNSETGILRCQNVTSSWGGARYLPHAFTEQGIYMLMTVLKGELATKQSRALVMTFKAMKDYIISHQSVVSKVIDNSKDIAKIKTEINQIASEMTGVVKKSEISPILLDFAKVAETKEFLILNGEPMRAKETYQDILSKAEKRIYIIDNYISIKTLRLLQAARPNIEVIFFSDNVGSCLYGSDVKDFKKDRKDLKIKFIRTNNAVHDRFIIIDGEKFYHCGASSKDAGKRIAILHEITDKQIVKIIKGIVIKMANNRELILK
ncbi:MAG: ORF6N domain-containing protein [Candidatus Saccharibacteria bacterium]|nr:ORF6N domain-containing protein [Candidatus Saccharibacteria bacterium]